MPSSFRSLITELREANPQAAILSPEDEERRLISKRYPQNPFIYQARMSPHTFTVGFKTATKKTNEPLWWTGTGFKDLGLVRGDPAEFQTREEAEDKIRTEILSFIRQWRADQQHLIIGWP